jgi:hypothetical protein
MYVEMLVKIQGYVRTANHCSARLKLNPFLSQTISILSIDIVIAIENYSPWMSHNTGGKLDADVGDIAVGWSKGCATLFHESQCQSLILVL